MNISNQSTEIENLAALFHALGQPARIRILLVLATRPACVCHLEAALGLRQAYISQQLMALRDADLVRAEREGRNIQYSLARPEVVDLLRLAGKWLDAAWIPAQTVISGCLCPDCAKANGLMEGISCA